MSQRKAVVTKTIKTGRTSTNTTWYSADLKNGDYVLVHREPNNEYWGQKKENAICLKRLRRRMLKIYLNSYKVTIIIKRNNYIF